MPVPLSIFSVSFRLHTTVLEEGVVVRILIVGYKPHPPPPSAHCRQLERVMFRYNVPTAYIDGRAVATLASDEINAAKLTNVQLLQCVANVDQVRRAVEG